MKAFRLHDFGGPASLRLDDLPDPRPGPGQVLLRMRAASLNHRDLRIARGEHPGLALPLVPVSDGVGEVAAVGPGVTRVAVGERVAGTFFQRWLAGAFREDLVRSALGGDVDGVLAEYVVLSEEGLVHVPEHLSDAEAATLPCAALTAWNALIAQGGLTPGETVLTLGTGGVSIFALQFARLAGARVILTSSSDAKLERARELGASDTINYRATPDWDRRVLELTDGAGVDHVVEVGGIDTFARSVRALRLAGRISLIGVLSGGGAVDLGLLHRRRVHLQGINVGSREIFEAMSRAVALHGLRPLVDRVFGFEEAPAALQYLQSGAHFGKVVLQFRA
ncbi:MAG: NAD(P)-dependent alcohol dehydrogenase [Chloroflexi bacterium]|nr:NAD(P)-dependent alcohol dehydrogenase [Chloroflexota bacterium]